MTAVSHDMAALRTEASRRWTWADGSPIEPTDSGPGADVRLRIGALTVHALGEVVPPPFHSASEDSSKSDLPGEEAEQRPYSFFSADHIVRRPPPRVPCC